LELTARLSDELGDEADIVLLDQAGGFVFGFSKLDVMFGRTTAAAVQHSYRTWSSRVSGSFRPPSGPSTRCGGGSRLTPARCDPLHGVLISVRSRSVITLVPPS
jgi:hypothetical protein